MNGDSECAPETIGGEEGGKEGSEGGVSWGKDRGWGSPRGRRQRGP